MTDHHLNSLKAYYPNNTLNRLEDIENLPIPNHVTKGLIIHISYLSSSWTYTRKLLLFLLGRNTENEKDLPKATLQRKLEKLQKEYQHIRKHRPGELDNFMKMNADEIYDLIEDDEIVEV